jgi:4-alpha-glucanotransferase
MADPEITRRAIAAGIAPAYENWRHERVEVSQETLESLLAALDRTPADGPAPGSRGPAPAAPPAPAGGPGIPALPERRSWGFTIQLYSVRSRQSWGHGDLRDLADLAAWSARELGAGFVLVNPLHAAEPLAPVSPSPYLPTSRLFTSPLYLRVEDIDEYRNLEPAALAAIEQLAAPLRARSRTAELIGRDAV